MPFIYKITNTITGEIYVGKTKQTLQKRWQGHCYDMKRSNCLLYQAMRKYGIKNFGMEQLEECDAEIAEIREQYWIKKLDTYRNGYNSTLGGDGNLLFDYETILDVYDLTENQLITAEILSVHVQTVKRALRAYGYPFADLATATEQSVAYQVSMFSLSGEYLRTFDSLSQAADYCLEHALTKTRHAAVARISDNIRGKTRSAYGFRWEYMIPEDYLNEDAYW